MRQRAMQRARLAILRGAPDQMNPDLPIKEQVDLLSYDSEWEFPVDRLILGNPKFIGRILFFI